MDNEHSHTKPNEERPLECGGCKKPIAVRYTLAKGDQITHTVMCSDCPQLQTRLHGIPDVSEREKVGHQAGLTCGNCGTQLDAVRRGSDLGCSECYEVFGDILLKELQATGKLSQQMLTGKKKIPSHIGRKPGEQKEMNTSTQLLALNEALSETVKREDYEQAAILRDQIKKLTENDDGEK